MPTGIEITCRKRFGQFLITQQPSLVRGEADVILLRWKAPVFVPLPAGVRHQLVVQFPYMGRPCGVAEVAVDLRDGEVQKFNYTAPHIVYSSGKIARTR
jgi:hypothetical protein